MRIVRTRTPSGGLALALVLIGLALLPAAAANDSIDGLLSAFQVTPLGNRPPPPFKLESLDGGAVSLADVRGRAAMLYFWESTCRYCARELPSTIEQAHRELREQGLVVLAINLGERRDLVAGWVKSRGVTSTVLLDANGEAQKSYQIAYTPTVFLVDRQGRLVGKAIGERQWTGDQGQALLRALLARKS
jgi:peroxiredoxin